MNKFRFLVLAICAFSVSVASAGTGDFLGLSPFWNWKQIETEHFRIVFPAPLAKQAERVANIYEQANSDLGVDLRWKPHALVNVLVVDNADAANGLTTPVSRFGMLLYLTPPDPYFSTDAYDDWLRLLIYHEYTHFLNMDASRGFWAVTRYIFGDVLLPNSTWPSWMLEGYAVYDETKYTKTGRGRSPYWEGILRTIVEENALDRSDSITLDEVNIGHPHFPDGEIAYLFGYNLMNTAERTKTDALGEMTFRGSRRFPYLINGNVKNITGKDWYDLWDTWVGETNAKMKGQLATIKRQPVSKTEIVDGTSDNSYGVAFSPDGRWIAYSAADDDRWQTLKLREFLPGAKPKNIEDKFEGGALAFTPDSKRVVYSSLHKSGNYYLYSDIRAHDLATGKTYWITSDERARDPDVSRDGKWITYTVASESGTDLVVAELADVKGKLVARNPRKIVDAAPYDRVANPRFTADNRGVIFAWKKDGNVGEDLFYVPLATGTPNAVVADGSRNRMPALDAKGTLYFVSDRTGVDNLYRHDAPGKDVLVTNVTGAVWLPTFRGNEAYASVLSKDGFAIAKVELFPNGVDPAKVKVKIGEEAPTSSVNKRPININQASTVPAATGIGAGYGETKLDYPVENYSTIGTLAPRQWAPVYLSDNNSTYFGAEVAGYDDTFRHEYFAFGAYDTTSKSTDYEFQYENRMAGPSLDAYASQITNDIRSVSTNGGAPASYDRELQLGAVISFPFQQIDSTFTPAIGASIDRTAYYLRPDGGSQELVGRTKYVPREDVLFNYTAHRQSRLAVAPERGSSTFLGARRYDLGDSGSIYKGIFSHTQFFDLGNHSVLFPAVRAMKVNKRDFSYLDASTLNRGKKNQVLDPIYSDNFDQFSIRGYPNATISSTEAITFSTDLRFPIAQIFRGWGTNPIGLSQLAMQLFAEDTYRPYALSEYRNLASAGAGLRLGVDVLLNLPLTLGLDYNYGFNKNAFGEGELFFSITAANLLPF
jgi:Tol biopolymer transport system component